MGHANAPMVFGVLGAIEMGLEALSIPRGRGAEWWARRLSIWRVIGLAALRPVSRFGGKVGPRLPGFDYVMVRHIVGDHQLMLRSFERIGLDVMPQIRDL